LKLIASLGVCSFLILWAQAPSPNPFQGSVPPQGNPAAPLSLSLQDAIQRGLRYNLGLLLGDQTTRTARAAELRARAALRPNLSGRISDTYEQLNLAALGFNFNFPGINIPKIVGPFNIFDARAYLTQTILDFSAINNHRAATESSRAADLTQRDARDLVVQLVASGYLQILSDGARADEAQSEVNTAQALYQRALDMKNAGVTPAIDALRAQVELQSEQTRLRGLQNDRAKDLLALARLIGVPLEQNVVLAEAIPYTPLTGLTAESAFERALKNRSDYQAAAAQVRASELSKRAAIAERLPAADLNADYGTIGSSPWSNHGTITLTGSVRFSIFDSGRIHADIEQADAALEQRKAEAADLRQRIDLEVRDAILDLETAADQVAVAASSEALAREALTQAQDRFAAGVAENIEVVQAQNALTNASDTRISAVYAHNLAKVALARSLGITDQGIREFLGGK
jgi:outer membrane protein TolC